MIPCFCFLLCLSVYAVLPEKIAERLMYQFTFPIQYPGMIYVLVNWVKVPFRDLVTVPDRVTIFF